MEEVVKEILDSSKPLSVPEKNTACCPRHSRMGANWFIRCLKNIINQRQSKKIKYCIVLIILFLIASTVISTFVFPAMLAMFDVVASRLPLETRLFLTAKNWIESHFLYLIVAIPIFFAIFKLYPFFAGRWRVFGLLIEKIPIVGSIHKYSVSWKLCLITGSLLKFGIPLGEALSTAGRGLRMPLLTKAADRISTRLEMGATPEDAIREDRDIPDCVRWAADLAYANNNLSETLIKLGNTYRDIESIFKERALSIAFVFFILLISAMIFTTLLLPVYMPLFTMAGAV